MKIAYKILHERAIVPQYQTKEAAGFDLHACIDEQVVIESGQIGLVPTGLALEIPKGFEGQIRPRSGLAFKNGVTVLNTPGTIDSDYRGEIKVILINHGKEPFKIEQGDRIAQMVIARHETAIFELSDELSESERGEKRFGSTGVK